VDLERFLRAYPPPLDRRSQRRDEYTRYGCRAGWSCAPPISLMQDMQAAAAPVSEFSASATWRKEATDVRYRAICFRETRGQCSRAREPTSILIHAVVSRTSIMKMEFKDATPSSRNDPVGPP